MSRSKRKTSPEPATTLFVKNMVCERCVRVVKEELESVGLTVERVLLGEVSVRPEHRSIDLKEIRSVLERSGFELIEDRKARVIEEIKNALVTLIHQDHEEHPLTQPYSRYLSTKLGKNYHYLGKLPGVTIHDVQIGRAVIESEKAILPEVISPAIAQAGIK